MKGYFYINGRKYKYEVNTEKIELFREKGKEYVQWCMKEIAKIFRSELIDLQSIYIVRVHINDKRLVGIGIFTLDDKFWLLTRSELYLIKNYDLIAINAYIRDTADREIIFYDHEYKKAGYIREVAE